MVPPVSKASTVRGPSSTSPHLRASQSLNASASEKLSETGNTRQSVKES